MATPTYDALATTTLTGSVSTVTFSSIDQSYGDLILIAYVNKNASGFLDLQFNDDTGSNYSYVEMSADGSNDSSGSGTQSSIFCSPSSTIDALVRIEIIDYAATDKDKTVLVRSDDADDTTVAVASRWDNTSAITKILIDGNRNFQAGSTFSLYGVAK